MEICAENFVVMVVRCTFRDWGLMWVLLENYAIFFFSPQIIIYYEDIL